MLQALAEPRKTELERADKKGKMPSRAKVPEKMRGQQNNRREEVPPTRSLGPRFDRATLSIQKEDRPAVLEADYRGNNRHYCTYHLSMTHNTANVILLKEEKEELECSRPRYHLG